MSTSLHRGFQIFIQYDNNNNNNNNNNYNNSNIYIIIILIKIMINDNVFIIHKSILGIQNARRSFTRRMARITAIMISSI